MKRNYILAIAILIVIAVIGKNLLRQPAPVPYVAGPSSWWAVQSIDTMKYSRDLSRQMLKESSFDAVIDTQVGNIARTGATHVAIATPYDEEFMPMLSRWVAAARKYNLHVWFRGNFSGWEKWFGYEKITREQHLAKTKKFIAAHPELFENGDMFTSCPECENGGPGDPRQTGDVVGHRLFLISEYQAVSEAFKTIHKNVSAQYNSMNYDVARAIMDKPTTQALGGIVTIDHYVATPEKLARDIHAIAQASGGKVFLGEFGVPIPDIHGDLTDAAQAAWIGDALLKLTQEKSLVGLNYWVGVGGSTKIWNDNGTPRSAVASLRSFFLPMTVAGTVTDQFHTRVVNAEVASTYKTSLTNASGQFTIPIQPNETKLRVHVPGYEESDLTISTNDKELNIVIKKQTSNIFEYIWAYIQGLFQ